MLNKRAIKQDADAILVAESLGLTLHRRGNRIMVLCPAHADKKIGSCFLDHRGLRCYSCGAKLDVFDMVATINDCSFPEAVQYVAEICGGEEYYQTEEKETLGFISYEARQTINLPAIPVYASKEATYDYEYAMSLRSEGAEIDEFEEDDGNILFVVKTCIDRDPLFSLFREDPDIYRQIIDTHCQSRIWGFEEVFRTRNSSTLPKMLCDIVGESCVSRAIKTACNEILEISRKYGNGLAVSDRNLYTTAAAQAVWKNENSAF